MPAVQRGHVRRLPSGKVQLRYYDEQGQHRSGGVFPTKSAALKHFRNVVEPRLLGEPESAPDRTLSKFVDLYLDRHAVIRRSKTITTLRERPGYATRAYGDVSLRELERMSADLADWQANLPARSRY